MNEFEALGLNSEIVKAVTELGFTSPTPVQKEAIPQLLTGSNDLVALAQTGTGKTAAFGLPMSQLIDFNLRQVQGLILCPTRELCLQITNDLKSFNKHNSNAHIVAIYGGASIQMQEKDIRRGAQIVVATPGRMVDMIDRGIININNVRYAVLDEADEMLNMGFKEDLDNILKHTPATKNTWLFSATMPAEVLRISRNYMKSPVEITVGNRNEGAANIEHIYYLVHARDKYSALKRIADYNPDIFAIVFCRTKAETQEVADHLIKDGYNADALHGDLSQAQRDHVMKRYRSKNLQMLVATDVAARGIDVNNVTHVINYNLPDDVENYTHRSGRTARAGKSGVSIVILNMKEVGKIRQIERIINKKFVKQQIPSGEEVCEKQLFHLIKKIQKAEVNEKGIAQYLPKIMEELKDLSREDLIVRFVSDEFTRFLEYYKNIRDINVDARMPREGGVKTSRLFVNIGQLDGLDRDKLKTFINETAKLDALGVIDADVKKTFSFIEVESKNADIILAAFKNIEFNGRPVRIDMSSGRKEGFSEGPRRSYGGGGGGRGDGNGRSQYKKTFSYPREGGSRDSGRRSESRDGGYKKPYGDREKRSFGRDDNRSDRPERSSSSGASENRGGTGGGGDRKDKFRKRR